ncbi:MAG: 1-acyl-sn-glycerol-3-phosphate acyltransferase [Candidatus Caccosoma sp.]|nr:1-acyl-sn-glycerol-3-phosphate acyltransferase [Candidatus Caccosoma sp.]
MKIKVKDAKYTDLINQKKVKHKKPKNPSWFLRKLILLLNKKELKEVQFSAIKSNVDKIDKKEPCLILMNHSSFIDLKIAFKLLSPRRFNIVCTDDGFVGKEWLLRHLGCIPTSKFITDVNLVKDMLYAKNKLHNSILMYPEASYSFDGTSTPLPTSIGKCIKLLDMPVIVIKTSGAFLRDPLYNNLQLREVKISAKLDVILSRDEIKNKKAEEIQEIIVKNFAFDNFKDQQDNKIEVNEPFRADYLNRVLYKCPNCLKEGMMEGKGIYITCNNCNAKYELTKYGYLKAVNCKEIFNHIPSWYKWERECVKDEILSNSYNEEIKVAIFILLDYKRIYKVGEGILKHSISGFELIGPDGLHYFQKPIDTYSLYSDFYWYEIGDVVCIGIFKMRYYCVPLDRKDIVAKLRLATEEIYKITKNSKNG